MAEEYQAAFVWCPYGEVCNPGMDVPGVRFYNTQTKINGRMGLPIYPFTPYNISISFI
jgi:hypothetical protein